MMKSCQGFSVKQLARICKTSAYKRTGKLSNNRVAIEMSHGMNSTWVRLCVHSHMALLCAFFDRRLACTTFHVHIFAERLAAPRRAKNAPRCDLVPCPGHWCAELFAMTITCSVLGRSFAHSSMVEVLSSCYNIVRGCSLCFAGLRA